MHPIHFPKATDGNLNHGQYRGGFWSGLSPDTRKAFLSISHRVTYPEGAVLFAEQEDPRGVFVIVSGSAKNSMTSADGRTVILNINRTGDVMGLQEAVGGETYQTTAETLELSEIRIARRGPFLNFLHDNPDVTLQVARELGHQYYTACGQVRTLALLHSASKKLAWFFMEWASRAKWGGFGAPAKLPLTHEEIGQIIGISRETVTRTLTRFRNQRLVRIDHSTLLIENPATLGHFAQV